MERYQVFKGVRGFIRLRLSEFVQISQSLFFSFRYFTTKILALFEILLIEKILCSQKPLIVLLIMAAVLEQVATTVIKIWNQHAASGKRTIVGSKILFLFSLGTRNYLSNHFNICVCLSIRIRKNEGYAGLTTTHWVLTGLFTETKYILFLLNITQCPNITHISNIVKIGKTSHTNYRFIQFLWFYM